MQLDSARGLKQLVSDTILASLTAGSEEAVRSLALAAGPMTKVTDILPSLALGLALKKSKKYYLAVRCHHHHRSSYPGDIPGQYNAERRPTKGRRPANTRLRGHEHQGAQLRSRSPLLHLKRKERPVP